VYCIKTKTKINRKTKMCPFHTGDVGSLADLCAW